jgi:hypothetical protein
MKLACQKFCFRCKRMVFSLSATLKGTITCDNTPRVKFWPQVLLLTLFATEFPSDSFRSRLRYTSFSSWCSWHLPMAQNSSGLHKSQKLHACNACRQSDRICSKFPNRVISTEISLNCSNGRDNLDATAEYSQICDDASDISFCIVCAFICILFQLCHPSHHIPFSSGDEQAVRAQFFGPRVCKARRVRQLLQFGHDWPQQLEQRATNRRDARAVLIYRCLFFWACDAQVIKIRHLDSIWNSTSRRNYYNKAESRNCKSRLLVLQLIEQPELLAFILVQFLFWFEKAATRLIDQMMQESRCFQCHSSQACATWWNASVTAWGWHWGVDA